MSTAEDGNLDEVRSKIHANTNQDKHKNSNAFASYTKINKTNLWSSSIDTVVAKHLNSDSN